VTEQICGVAADCTGPIDADDDRIDLGLARILEDYVVGDALPNRRYGLDPW